jgi:hypothetical protein
MSDTTLLVGRVLSEDDDFITMEIGKHDAVTFHLQQNDEGETVGGDRFLTVVFVHNDGSGKAVPWVPWADA